jgi:uncharacterized repeat protein (TIGR01451 family)
VLTGHRAHADREQPGIAATAEGQRHLAGRRVVVSTAQATHLLGTGGTVECSLATLPPAASATFSITVTVDLLTGPLSNSASVTSYEPDSAPGNNTATADTSVSPADLSVSLQGAPNPATVGGSIVYTMTVTNLGPVTPSYVSLRLFLAPALQFVSSIPGLPICHLYLGAVYCTFQTSPWRARPHRRRPHPRRWRRLRPAVGNRFDPQQANNPASVTTTVMGATASQLVHGSNERHDLAAPCRRKADLYRIGQAPAPRTRSSDGVSGDLGPRAPSCGLRSTAPPPGSVLAGRGPAALRWENASGSAQDDELIQVRSLGCSTDCTRPTRTGFEPMRRRADPSFNNGEQSTIPALQNPRHEPCRHRLVWDGGAPAASHVHLAPREPTSRTRPAAGLPGRRPITITSDAGYGRSRQGRGSEPATVLLRLAAAGAGARPCRRGAPHPRDDRRRGPPVGPEGGPKKYLARSQPWSRSTRLCLALTPRPPRPVLRPRHGDHRGRYGGAARVGAEVPDEGMSIFSVSRGKFLR